MANREPQSNGATPERPEGSPNPDIRLVFERFQEFVDEYKPKISLSGVLVDSEPPRSVGSPVTCEFRLADGFLLCRAAGEVAWVLPTEDAARSAAMGVRFSTLDDQGRDLIGKIVEEQVKGGGETFDVDRVPAGAVEASAPQVTVGEASPSPPAPPAPPTPPGPREDPASTHARPAVTPESFNAPWGPELPGLPDDVIESTLDDQALLATAQEDFESDPDEAGFESDSDLLEMEGPDFGDLTGGTDAPDLSFSDAALDPPPQMPAWESPAEMSFEAEDEEPAEVPPEPSAPSEGRPRETTLRPEGRPPDTMAMSPAVAPLGTPWSATDPDPQEAPEIPDSEPSFAPSPISESLGPTSRISDEPSADTVSADPLVSSGGVASPPDESRLRSWTGDVRTSLAESKGRFVAIALILAAVVAGLVFKETVLGWVGLGAPTTRQAGAAALRPQAEPSSETSSADVESVEDLREPADAVATAADRPELIEVAATVPPLTPPTSSPPPPSPPPPSPRPPSPPPPFGSLQDAPATRVERITFDQAADGTLVTIWLDGRLEASRFEHQGLSYAPRKEQIVISGIRSPYASTIQVGTLEVDRIRTGHHESNRLNLVFDLSSEQMTVAETRVRDDRLEVLVRRR